VNGGDSDDNMASTHMGHVLYYSKVII